MEKSQYSPQIEVERFFFRTLQGFNQFKVQISGQSSYKNAKKDQYCAVQKLSQIQNYNPFGKQILLQKCPSSPFTPKKQIIQEIGQYISDRSFPKKSSLQNTQKIIEGLDQTPKSLTQMIIRPLHKLKLEEQNGQKINLSHKIIIKNNQNDEEQKSEQFEQQNNQDDRAPKKGLTYISKKLSLLLRQRKRMKSSQLFNIALFEDGLRHAHRQQPNNQNRPDQGLKQQPKDQKDQAQIKQSKQRRNVRRRIYDSINVMVALGIIKKVKNQFIYIEQKDDFADQYFTIQQEEILNKKKDYLEKLEKDCLYKEQCLKYLTEAYAKMKILRKLNAEYQDKLNSLNDNTSTQASSAFPEQKLQFPFVFAQNGNKKIKVELINESQCIEPRVKKANDWTDFIEIENKSRDKQIESIKILGQNLKVITDVDCINHLNCLEIQQHAQAFEKHQLQILRDYEIINQHKQKKSEQHARSAIKI